MQANPQHVKVEARPYKIGAPPEVAMASDSDSSYVASDQDDQGVHSTGKDAHRARNSSLFHKKQKGELMVLEDGLLSIGKSINGVGVSRFTSHHYVVPDFYRLHDGVVRPGSPADLVEFAASLPGLKRVWEELEEPQRIMRGLFDRRITTESKIHRSLTSACDRLLNELELGEYIYTDDQVSLGAYGIVPFSQRADKLAFKYHHPKKPSRPVLTDTAGIIYSPEQVAVAGKCDCVFYYGAESGKVEGQEAVAVIEEKIYIPPRLEYYHTRGNSVLAQIMTSMVGAEAPLGLIIANQVFKIFWQVRQRDGSMHMFTYPPGHDMADIACDSERLILGIIIFHIVRCSVKKNADVLEQLPPKVNIRNRLTESRGNFALEPPNPPTAPNPRRSPGDENSSNDNKGNFTRMECMDGSILRVKKYDCTVWSDQEQGAFLKEERKNKRALHAQLIESAQGS